MIALYFLLFLIFSIMLFLALMSAWFHDKKPSPGLLLLLVPALLFLTVAVRELTETMRDERTRVNLAMLLAEDGFPEEEIISITYCGRDNQYGLLREFDMPQDHISSFYDALLKSEDFYHRDHLPESDDCKPFTLTFSTDSQQNELTFHTHGIEECYLEWNDTICFTQHSPNFMIEFFNKSIFERDQAGDALSIVSLLESRGIFQNEVTGVTYTFFPTNAPEVNFTTADASELYWEFDNPFLYRPISPVELPEEYYSLLFTTPNKESSLTFYISAPDEAYVLWEDELYFTPQDILGKVVYSLQHAAGSSSGEIYW